MNTTEQDPGYCQGCGRTFQGARGLRSHQASKFLAMGCRRQDAQTIPATPEPETVQEDTMTENTTPRTGYEYAPGARPLNAPVLTAQQEATADLSGPTVPGGQYRRYRPYQAASPEVQAAVDLVFQEAVRNGGGSVLTVAIDQYGGVEAGWSAPGVDQYRVAITPEGRLDRLRKRNDRGDWVTVPMFSQDPAGKMFKRSRANAYANQTANWMDAVTR